MWERTKEKVKRSHELTEEIEELPILLSSELKTVLLFSIKA